ncbi:MAG: hypothetical protein K2X81_07290 [Candidatus Obscuribacterales bacterium]|nr:hypothetical protein [Candidatus Obscuribacterales bacterium]
MSNKEGDLAHNVQTLRDTCHWKPDGPECGKAYNEIFKTMQENGPLQTQLRDRNLISTEGNSLIIDPNIYPSDKQQN